MNKTNFRGAVILMFIIYMFHQYLNKDIGKYQVIDKYSVLDTTTGIIYKNGDTYNPVSRAIENAYKKIDEDSRKEDENIGHNKKLSEERKIRLIDSVLSTKIKENESSKMEKQENRILSYHIKHSLNEKILVSEFLWHKIDSMDIARRKSINILN